MAFALASLNLFTNVGHSLYFATLQCPGRCLACFMRRTFFRCIARPVSRKREDTALRDGLPGPVGTSLLGMALIVAATMWTTQWGARLARAINGLLRRRLFALLLALTSLRMFYGPMAAARHSPW